MRKLLIIIAVICTVPVFAQRAAISTDALGLASASPNFSLSVAATTRVTLDLDLTIHPFDELFSSDTRFTHIKVGLQSNYWFKRPYYSHSIGINALGSVYDISVMNTKYKGACAAFGVNYTYGFILSTRWALLTSIGVGCAVAHDGYTYDCKVRPALTKLGVSFAYLID